MLNAGITPTVHEYGSLGCSGDLAPLAHCALALIGEGTVRDAAGIQRPAAEALAAAGLTPVVLAEKEGLALINGTDGMLGMLVLAITDLRELLAVADIAAAMSVEGLLGTDDVFAADLQQLRPHPGQQDSAANLRLIMAGSEIRESHRTAACTRVQDAYSLRCSPQVAGAARDTVAHAARVAETELGSAIDNPVVTPDWTGGVQRQLPRRAPGLRARLPGHRDRGPGQHLRAPYRPVPRPRPELRPACVPGRRSRVSTPGT